MQNFYLLRNNLLCCNTLVKYMNTGNIVKWFKWIFFFRFCGNVAPPTINTNSSTVWVTFHSDGSIAGTGFAAQYRAVLPAQSQYSVFQISVFQTGGLGPRRATQKAGGKMWRKKVKWKNYILNHSFYLFYKCDLFFYHYWKAGMEEIAFIVPKRATLIFLIGCYSNV